MPFIGEACSPARGYAAHHGLGQAALGELTRLREDHRGDVVVIAAGYPAETAEFLAADPGPASRFSRPATFAPYTPGELVLIVRHLAAGRGFELDAGAGPSQLARFRTAEEAGSAANARDTPTLFDTMNDGGRGGCPEWTARATRSCRRCARTTFPSQERARRTGPAAPAAASPLPGGLIRPAHGLRTV